MMVVAAFVTTIHQVSWQKEQNTLYSLPENDMQPTINFDSLLSTYISMPAYYVD